MTFSGAISGVGGILSKAGTGTLILSGTNSHTGGTTLTGGYIEADTSSALGSGTFNFNAPSPGGVNSGLRLINGVAITNPITFTAGGTSGRGAFDLISGAATISGPITLNGSTNAGGHFGSTPAR